MDVPKSPITIEIVETPDGVLIHATGDLRAPGPAASVAGALCRFADGLVDAGRPVRLDPDIIAAVM